MSDNDQTPAARWRARTTPRDRIFVIGNGGGGKTTLAYAIADATSLPIHEIDQIQFLPGWEVAPSESVAAQVRSIIAEPRWLIDGFGPWETIEERSHAADTVIFVDFPVWIHFWWAAERQIAAVRGEARLGGPEDCPLTEKTREVFEAIGRVHEQIRPRLMELFEALPDSVELLRIASPEELEELHEALRTP